MQKMHLCGILLACACLLVSSFTLSARAEIHLMQGLEQVSSSFRQLPDSLSRLSHGESLSEPRPQHAYRLWSAPPEHSVRPARPARHYDAALGRQLVSFAREHISGGSSQCYYYVAQTLHNFFPPFLEGMEAYMAADYLAVHPAFAEIHVPVARLAHLPAGAVVVWGKGHSVSGHISIADGEGKEISDHIQDQMLSHYGGAGARVFVPVHHNRYALH